jgi:hypothetical protein
MPISAPPRVSNGRAYGLASALFLLAYVLGPGPIAWLHAKDRIPQETGHYLWQSYRPLAWVAERTGQSARMQGYVDHCALMGRDQEGSYTPLFMFLFRPIYLPGSPELEGEH